MELKQEMPPIDFGRVISILWENRRKYYLVLPVVLIGTYLFMLFIPRYYRCSASLVPETTTNTISGSMESLASSFGLGSLSKLNSSDAIYAEIYPEVVASKNFIVELLPVEIKTQDGEICCDYYTYLRDYQKAPWWRKLMSSITEWINPTPPDTCAGNEGISVFNHTKQQEGIFMAVQGNITCNYDKKTDIVHITVKDQDPLVCATMTDTTCRKLQEFIVKYRTKKARIDYEFYEQLCKKSKAEYEEAVEKYARNVDAYTNTVLATYKTKTSRLENDMLEKYNIYLTMNTQMQAAAAKLQEATPAFSVIESASVPHKPAGPKRVIIAIFMTILACFGLSIKLLVKHYPAQANKHPA